MSSELTLSDGIEIHAKALRRRLGKAAPEYARGRAHQLRKQGDYEGEKVWLRVAAAAKRMRNSDCALPTIGF